MSATAHITLAPTEIAAFTKTTDYLRGHPGAVRAMLQDAEATVRRSTRRYKGDLR
jgi:hypothetical protein